MNRYAIILACLMLGLGLTHWKAYSHGKEVVQAKFDTYKGNINDQVQKANAKATAIKAEQDAKYDKAKLDYADVSRDLDAALKRLRKPPSVPRNESLPVAGCSGDTVSTEAGNTERIAPAVEITAGACEGSEFWENALRDTLQCSRLIEFVSSARHY